MNETKFLGVFVVLASLIISGTIIWSTKVNQDSLSHLQFSGATGVQIEGIPNVSLAGPVTIAPASPPFPVSVSGTENPVSFKVVQDKKWVR